MGKSYLIVLPEGLKDFVVERLKSNVKYKDLDLDYALFILSLMKIEYNKEGEFYYSEYKSFESGYLQKIARKYKNYMRFFGDMIEGKNILYRVNYAVGFSCYKYKLTNGIVNGRFEFYRITNRSLLKKIMNKTGKIKTENIKNIGLFTRFYDNQYVKIDEDVVNNMLASKGEIRRTELLKDLKFLEGVVALNNNDFRVVRKENCSRLYSAIVYFKKEFRKALRIQFEEVEGIDMSGSIPTMLGFLLSNPEQSQSVVDKVLSKSDLYTYYMLVKNQTDVDISEVERYLDVVLKGEIYDEFITLIDVFYKENVKDKSTACKFYLKYSNKHSLDGYKPYYDYFKDYFQKENVSYDEKRTVVKRDFLAMLNAKPNQFRLMNEIFGLRFPTIHNFICKLKEFDESDGLSNNRFAYIMYRIETYFMIDLLSNHIYRKYKGRVAFYTIHDCVLTAKRNIHKIQTAINDVFSKYMGFVPTFKLEYLNTEK